MRHSRRPRLTPDAIERLLSEIDALEAMETDDPLLPTAADAREIAADALWLQEAA